MQSLVFFVSMPVLLIGIQAPSFIIMVTVILIVGTKVIGCIFLESPRSSHWHF